MKEAEESEKRSSSEAMEMLSVGWGKVKVLYRNIILTFSVHIQKLMKTLLEIKWVDDTATKVWWGDSRNPHTHSTYSHNIVELCTRARANDIRFCVLLSSLACVCVPAKTVPNFAVMQMYVCL